MSNTYEALQKAAEKVKQISEALEAAKTEARGLWNQYQAEQADMQRLLFGEQASLFDSPEATAKKRGRPKGSTSTASGKPDGRAERSIESRFGTSLTRMMNSKAIPSVTPDRAEAERMLNDAAANVAAKNQVEVPDSVWKRIDEHLKATYGEKVEASTKKAKTAKG